MLQAITRLSTLQHIKNQYKLKINIDSYHLFAVT